MFEPISNPWNVIESDFPATGAPSEQLHFLLSYAILAPSRHNTQPWLFKVEGNAVELYADRSRALPVTDPDGREMIISCDAALANLLIALRHFGYAAIVEMHTDPEKRDLLAHVSLEKGGEDTEEVHKLFHAILQRRTNRQLFKDRAVPKSLLSALEDIAGREGTSFQVVQGEEARYAVASLIATGERMLWADERFRQEIAAWTRPVESQSRDGVPASALGTGEMASYLGPLRIRTFMVHGEASKEHHLAAGSPVLAMLWTFTDTWFDWLAAGQAVERILLHARAAGAGPRSSASPSRSPRCEKRYATCLGEQTFHSSCCAWGTDQMCRLLLVEVWAMCSCSSSNASH